MKPIAIGCDEAAYAYKEELKKYLEDKGLPIKDYGVYDESPVLYPSIAHEVAKAIRDGHSDRGLLLCGTGIGMAMTANKVPGIRAAQCHDVFSAERAVKSNNAQIISMGSRVIGIELAKKVLDVFLESEYTDCPSGVKIDKMMEYDAQYRK